MMGHYLPSVMSCNNDKVVMPLMVSRAIYICDKVLDCQPTRRWKWDSILDECLAAVDLKVHISSQQWLTHHFTFSGIAGEW